MDSNIFGNLAVYFLFLFNAGMWRGWLPHSLGLLKNVYKNLEGHYSFEGSHGIPSAGVNVKDFGLATVLLEMSHLLTSLSLCVSL